MDKLIAVFGSEMPLAMFTALYHISQLKAQCCGPLEPSLFAYVLQWCWNDIVG